MKFEISFAFEEGFSVRKIWFLPASGHPVNLHLKQKVNKGTFIKSKKKKINLTHENMVNFHLQKDESKLEQVNLTHVKWCEACVCIYKYR